jgi:hypothetical protein
MTSEHDLSRTSRDGTSVEKVCGTRGMKRENPPSPGRFMSKGISGVTHRTHIYYARL